MPKTPRSREELGESQVSLWCSSLAPLLLLPASVPLTPVNTMLLQRGHKTGMPAVHIDTGTAVVRGEGAKPPPACSVEGMSASLCKPLLSNLQLPKMKPAEKKQTQTMFSPNPGH